ncbi:Ras-interacting protein 1, partial [Chelonia mydas]
GLWINSPKKHFVKMSRRWPSVGSVSGAGVGGGRWGSEKKLADLIDPVPEDLVELSSQPQLPGILKIFGGAISRGANYKSVLATPRSTARQLVREALERYGVAPEEEEGGYVLCDVVGRFEGPGGAWQAEHLRPVGDTERPLVLQDVWKPKAGLSRRFEVRRRCEVERVGEAEDNETAGEGAGGLPPSPGGSQARSHGTPSNLGARKRRERKAVLSVAGAEVGPAGEEQDGEVAPAQETEPADGGAKSGEAEDSTDGANLEQLSQCLIQPPTQHPYFLLLLGCDKQDFVIYVMTRRRHVFGRRLQPDKGGYVDTFLCAPDILPRHCCVREAEPAPGLALVRPFRGAAVTLNGGALVREAELHPGDLLGLGQHFLFMYKDPRTPQPRPAWLPQPWASPGLAGAFSCQACGRSLQERQDAFQAYVESREPELRYRPQEEEALLREIVRLQGATAFNLAPAFLLGLCLEHSTSVLEPGHFPRLVARMAQLVKEAVWEKIKEVGDRQPENQQDKGQVGALSIEEVAADLRPLMLWMANAMELLNLVQKKVLDMEKELDLEGSSHDALLSSDLETCDEAMAVLDEVIMSTFQQSVYYLTKTLYSALPALLDSNPFTAAADLSHAQELSTMPEGIRGTLAIYQATLELTRECELHPDLVSQTFGYLFFFSNASLFNTLMERGEWLGAGTPGLSPALGGEWGLVVRAGSWEPGCLGSLPGSGRGVGASGKSRELGAKTPGFSPWLWEGTGV